MKSCGLKLKFFRRLALVLVKLVRAVAETGHRRFHEPVRIYPFNFETSHVNRSAWYGKSDERLRGSGYRFSVICCFYFFQAAENENSLNLTCKLDKNLLAFRVLKIPACLIKRFCLS